MTPHGRGESSMAPHGRGDNGMSSSQRRGDRHVGGSGRIMPTQTPPPEDGNWRGGWSSGANGNSQNMGADARGGKREEEGGAFDIGTWNNPAAAAGNEGSSENGSGSNGWKPMGANANWSTNDDNSSSSGGGWSTKDGTEAASFGTWENPDNKEQANKPERNAQNPSWNKQSGSGGIGNWSTNECKTPEKQTGTGSGWSTDTPPGSAEPLSPGTAWKNEPSFAGNWADSVVTPSPRSDQDENPLNISLEEKKSLQRQLGNQPNNPW